MNVQRQIDQLIALQAAQWYERLRVQPEERGGEFARWVTESPRHMEAFLSVASEAPLIRKAFASRSFDPGQLLQTITPQVLPLPRQADRIGNSADSSPVQQRRSHRLLPFAAAAAAAVLCAAGITFYQRLLSWQRFATPVGEQRTIQLSEGSIVNLNALSRVYVKFDELQRDVRLMKGEATFKVAPDRTRPFRVHTPGVVVEAVGTQFNVYARQDGTTTVSVLEGKVKISREANGFGQLRHEDDVPLAAGEEARVSASGHIERLDHADAAESIAWQQRKLVFKRTALEEIAGEFNRYNKATQIRLEGVESGRFRFTGAFSADDPQSLAALLMHEADLSVEYGRNGIVIRPRTAREGEEERALSP